MPVSAVLWGFFGNRKEYGLPDRAAMVGLGPDVWRRGAGMMAEGVRYGLVMLAAGVGIPILAALNAQLGARLGSPAAAAVCLFAVAFLVALGVLFLAGAGPLRNVLRQPPYLFGGGLLVAFYILSITWIAPHIGLGNAIILVLLGQMLSFSLIDHFGLMGALHKPLNLQRIIGILMLAAGAFLAIRA